MVFSTLAALFFGACRRQMETRPAALARRVVTLSPSLTEIVFALGAGDRVVGVSDYCDYPEAALKRPRVGSFLTPSIERILELRPDLVLLDGVQRDIAAVLEQAGARVLAVPMQDLSEVREAMVAIGTALGDRRAAGEALRDALDREIAEVRKKAAARPPRRTLFVVDRQPGSLRGLVVAGPGSYLDELIRLAGGRNVFGDLTARYAKVSVEALEERRPEVILDAVHTDSATPGLPVRDWQALTAVPAVNNGEVYGLAGREFITPGPRLGQALRELLRLLHPESAAEKAQPPGVPSGR